MSSINNIASSSTLPVTLNTSDSSITSPVLRLRGGAPSKKRCGAYCDATTRCSQVSLRIVGDCSYCEVSYCGRHRLPEDHACTGLESCRQAAFQKNKSKLESEQTGSRKIEAM